MTERMRQTNENLVKMAGSLQAKLNNEPQLKETIVKLHGLSVIEDEALCARKINELRQTIRIDAVNEFQVIQDRMKKSLADMESTRMRNIVQRTNGSQLVRQYADQHRISVEDARQELSEYAKRKTSQFRPDFLPDQYAALANYSTATDRDQDTASKILKEQLKDVNTADELEDISHYKHICSMQPSGMLDYYSGSGAAILNQINKA